MAMQQALPHPILWALGTVPLILALLESLDGSRLAG